MHFYNQSQKELKDATIMIVDDELINIDVVQAFLEEDGYRDFVTVEDSTTAIKILEAKRPDLLLLDLQMPDVSGFEILEAARSNPKFKHLPIIILTASTEAENKLRALDLGATDFLSKPLDQSELGLRVRNILTAKAYLDQLAFYDPLTKLPNRDLFMEELSWALKAARRHRDKLALLSIEIDDFDKLKNSMGSHAGDNVLCRAVERIQRIIRGDDIFGRMNKNEDNSAILFQMDNSNFSLLLNRIQSAENAAIAARRITKAIGEPIQLEDSDVYVTASIGIATYPPESSKPEQLLSLASSAKDFSKKQGGNFIQFSSKEINETYKRHLELAGMLRKAIQNNELVLFYQPKVNVKTGILQGAEALLRWQSSEGMIQPATFIPIAEETGLIIPIGEWVLREACRQLSEWQKMDIKPITLAVNLSARQFKDPDFLTKIQQIIEESRIDPQFLTLELTESLLINNVEEKINTLKKLKKIGFKLSIDDFGTGYSSFNYLRKLPVDELKIDRSFIMEVSEHEDSRAIVSSIAHLAKNLNLTTVAEGIERKEELEFLQTVDCNQYQGFYYSRPVPASEFITLVTG